MTDNCTRHRIEATRTDLAIPKPRAMEKTTAKSANSETKEKLSTTMNARAIATLAHVSSGSASRGRLEALITTWSMSGALWRLLALGEKRSGADRRHQVELRNLLPATYTFPQISVSFISGNRKNIGMNYLLAKYVPGLVGLCIQTHSSANLKYVMARWIFNM
jgi:hypothetical protein